MQGVAGSCYSNVTPVRYARHSMPEIVVLTCFLIVKKCISKVSSDTCAHLRLEPQDVAERDSQDPDR